MNTYLKNGRIVLEQAVIDGNLSIRDGVFDSAPASVDEKTETVECEGDFLVPGLIDLHTDQVERHARPRSATWPAMLAAVLAYDWQLVGGGITTVLDSISVGQYDRSSERAAMLDVVMQALTQARLEGLFRADHYLHLRCELSDPAVISTFDRFIDSENLRLASLMDHTPGQRQHSNLEIFRSNISTILGLTWKNDEEFEQYVTTGRESMLVNGVKNRCHIAQICHTHQIPLASHDDTTISDVEESHSSRVAISEFPTTVAAARRARELGMRIVMGAPNIVLGGSHSGNVSALELAKEGLLDILTSDYVPGSLLLAAFMLARSGFDLSRTVAMVTASPADAVGFTDRGRIAPGLRADLLLVRLVNDIPVIRGIWIGGRRVL